MRTTEELVKDLRRKGLRITPQRLRIFDALAGDDSHPTAEAIYDRVSVELPTISLKTIYQTLNELVAWGEIQSFELGTGARRYDPNTSNHHHLVCEHCGKIRDFYADRRHFNVPPGQENGFQVSDADVVFRGVCAACRQDGR